MIKDAAFELAMHTDLLKGVTSFTGQDESVSRKQCACVYELRPRPDLILSSGVDWQCEH